MKSRQIYYCVNIRALAMTNGFSSKKYFGIFSVRTCAQVYDVNARN